MAADGDSIGKSKDRKDRRGENVTNERVNRAGLVDDNGLESIPTVIPREGDGYRSSREGAAEQEPKSIGESGFSLTADDLRRINTRKGILELLENRGVDIQEVFRRC
ncbi:MAG: hypothetical protein HP490_10200 [Nitrospira sp.]|nr:hypothetical protein [Nitrospira sp.]